MGQDALLKLLIEWFTMVKVLAKRKESGKVMAIIQSLIEFLDVGYHLIEVVHTNREDRDSKHKNDYAKESFVGVYRVEITEADCT